ncbi:MAG: FAD-binding protein [Thermoguttaceae bacterium]|nr:FAD-binding protein [Thermoguttaceae bacterium]MDW8037299.1 FAD-linked oxidase C-terminal domain-containing protein [Thermoguttaceae bacterium]
MQTFGVQSQRIQEDLRGVVAGDVEVGDIFVHLFASDGSIYEIRPLCVVRPRSKEDVSACLRYAAEMRLPVHARGAGSGTAGGALGSGIVVDFSKYLRRILETGSDWVRCQPGIVYEKLNLYLLQKTGRHFGPNPGIGSISTIGGIIARDGAGNRWLRYGRPSDHLREVELVLADGQIIRCTKERIPLSPALEGLNQQTVQQRLFSQLADLLAQHADLIRQHHLPEWPFRRGYNLMGVLRKEANGEQILDVPRLIAGSEGTLALITEVVLATQSVPRARAVAILGFASLEGAARAVEQLLAYRPSLCDLMDRRHLRLACEHEVRLDVLLPRDMEAAVLVELDDEEPLALEERMSRLVSQVSQKNHVWIHVAYEPDERELLLSLARMARPGLYRIRSRERPVPVLEDLGVLPSVLADFLVRVRNIFQQYQITAAMYCHAGHGLVHFEPFLDLQNPAHRVTLRRLADEVYEQVYAFGGTLGLERGWGWSRAPYLVQQEKALYPLMQKIKQLWDPEGILNPGKLISSDREQLIRNLRVPVRDLNALSSASAESGSGLSESALADSENPVRLRDLTELQLDWHPQQVAEIAEQCFGCGRCRTQSLQERMCPFFRVGPAEEASPRAKANLLRAILCGRLSLASLIQEELKGIMDFCFHCHSCRLECPAAVDIPRLVCEAKGAYVAAKGSSFSDWLLIHLDSLAAWGSLLAPLLNVMFGSRWFRWLMEKSFGIAQGRKLPRLAAQPFLRRADRHRWTRPVRGEGPKVALFVDLYANYFDPSLAEALVRILHRHGIQVYVPPEQKWAGIPALALGQMERFRRLAEHNTTLLAEAVRQGYHIITPEPAAALCLIHEYRWLLDDEDAQLVATNTTEATTYLWRLHTRGQLDLRFQPIQATLGYHLPCRLRALEVGAPGENLLRLIPGLVVHRLEEGCSGMGGTFGLKREHYRTSLRMGWPLISRLRDPDIQAGTTECSACKIQMEQGTTKPTLHPIKLLAYAYGLLPEVETLLHRPGKELLVT